MLGLKLNHVSKGAQVVNRNPAIEHARAFNLKSPKNFPAALKIINADISTNKTDFCSKTPTNISISKLDICRYIPDGDLFWYTTASFTKY